MSERWVKLPEHDLAHSDPAAYPAAAMLATATKQPYVAGPYIFKSDGTHVVRAGWRPAGLKRTPFDPVNTKVECHECYDHKAALAEVTALYK